MSTRANNSFRGRSLVFNVMGCLAALVFVFGCGGGGGESSGGGTSTAKKADAPKAAAPKIDAATAGTISGSIAFEGEAPKMTKIDMGAEPTCHDHAETDPVMTENVIVNSNGTLKNVFIYVKSGLEGMEFPPPSDPVEIDQIGCTYHPHVFGIQAKQPLLIKNSDEGVLHNIHAFSTAGNGFNFGMPKVMESEKTFRKPEIMVRIKCDVHGWMNSYAGVTNHPYYAVTGDDGSFKLAPLPPGDYVIEAWHEEYGSQTQNVTVGQSETKEITFTFKPAS